MLMVSFKIETKNIDFIINCVSLNLQTLLKRIILHSYGFFRILHILNKKLNFQFLIEFFLIAKKNINLVKNMWRFTFVDLFIVNNFVSQPFFHIFYSLRRIDRGYEALGKLN